MTHKLSDFKNGEGLHNPDIQSVVITAEVVKQQISAMGGNDSEFDSIATIVKKAREGILGATDAILQIEFVRDSKHGNGGHGLEG